MHDQPSSSARDYYKAIASAVYPVSEERISTGGAERRRLSVSVDGKRVSTIETSIDELSKAISEEPTLVVEAYAYQSGFHTGQREGETEGRDDALRDSSANSERMPATVPQSFVEHGASWRRGWQAGYRFGYKDARWSVQPFGFEKLVGSRSNVSGKSAEGRRRPDLR